LYHNAGTTDSDLIYSRGKSELL